MGLFLNQPGHLWPGLPNRFPLTNFRNDLKGNTMPHVFHSLFYHFAWAVKHREWILENLYLETAIEMVEKACQKRGIETLACNGRPDHLHLLVRLPPTLAPATFIGEIKGASSCTFNQRHGQQVWLKWQSGYGVVSLREEEQEKVVRYIEEQEERHRTRHLSKRLENCGEEK